MTEDALFLPRLEQRLSELAENRQTITYGALVKDLAVTGPGSVARLTAALETLMEVDHHRGHPYRAALCEARLANGLPALGFFDKAAALGADIGDPVAFVSDQRHQLFAKAAN